MAQKITARIDLDKIPKEAEFQGKKGRYVDIVIWQNDNPDSYGNDVSVQLPQKEGEQRIYIGNGKTQKPK